MRCTTVWVRACEQSVACSRPFPYRSTRASLRILSLPWHPRTSSLHFSSHFLYAPHLVHTYHKYFHNSLTDPLTPHSSTYRSPHRPPHTPQFRSQIPSQTPSHLTVPLTDPLTDPLTPHRFLTDFDHRFLTDLSWLPRVSHRHPTSRKFPQCFSTLVYHRSSRVLWLVAENCNFT